MLRPGRAGSAQGLGCGAVALSLLEIRNLRVSFGGFTAVDGVDLDVAEGELLGIVGESGSGKSVSMMALMGLIDAPGVVSADALRFAGQDLLTMSAAQRRRIVGKDIAMVFQDALNSLNPSHTVATRCARCCGCTSTCAVRRWKRACWNCLKWWRYPLPRRA